MLSRLVASDVAVKIVFDHFRNVGIVGAILAAATWAFNNVALSDPFSLVNTVAWVCLTIIGIFLFVVNELYAHRRLKEANISWLWQALITLVYGFSILSFIGSVIVAR